jgi:hypothetical protein
MCLCHSHLLAAALSDEALPRGPEKGTLGILVPSAVTEDPTSHPEENRHATDIHRFARLSLEGGAAMRWFSAAVLVALLGASLLAADDKAQPFRLSKDELGKVPTGWKADKTGKGEGSVWKVVADNTAPSKTGLVLAQTAAGPGSLFNLCVADQPSLKDVELTVAFKAIKGSLDQGGGVVWRFQDHNNYYIARMNPLEDNYRVYKVIGGKRIQLETKEGIKVPTGEWHMLRIKMIGDHIECFLDGKKELDAKDGTIQKAGKVGLWSKADAQSHFDQFTVKDRKVG